MASLQFWHWCGTAALKPLHRRLFSDRAPRSKFCTALNLTLALLLTPQVHAQITIDGVLDEPEWRDALVFEQFVTTEPLTSQPAKYATQVRVITDDKGIYIGFSNYQPPEVSRVHRRFRRDAHIEADRNVVGIDFDHAGLAGYDFTVGSTNSKQDGIMTAGGWSADWDGTWYSQTSANEDYWYSEIYIPWTVAPMSRSKGEQKRIGLWFSRVVYAESLRFAYPNASFERPTFIADWHSLEIGKIEASTLDWFPYLSYTNEMEEGDDEWKVGLDMVWRPDASTQLTGALNPDYGQVESDDLVVNFSAFETFRSEKRPFFTENQAMFTSLVPNGDRVVHTRRVGAGSDAGDEGVTDIDAAAKFTHYGESLDYGVFAVTEDDTGLSKGRDFVSTRIQHNNEGLTLGHRLTYVDRSTLNRTAMVNALDVDWQPGAMRVSGQLLLSDIEQRANNFNGQTSLDEQDYAGWASWAYSPSDEWSHKLELTHYGDEFDMNDMGFMLRNDQNTLVGEERYHTLEYPEDSTILTSYWDFDYGYEENTEGDRLALWGELTRNWVFKSSREVDIEVGYQSAGWDDRITRGNGLYALPVQYWGTAHYAGTRDGKFTYSATAFTETSGTDEPSYGVIIEPKLYITETLTLSSRVLYQYFKEWLLWDYPTEQLATFESDRYVLDLEMDWYPSPRQEVRVKFQWVAVSADAVTGYDLDERGNPIDSDIPVSDFSLSDTALQIRYRYELAPLSDIYLVYSRGGFFSSNDTDDGPWDLLQAGWREKQVETIVAKIRYRF